MRLAQGLYSVVVLIRGAWKKASPGIVLSTGANQWSPGTRLALGLYTPHWCSPGEPGMRLAQGLCSVLVLTRGAGEQGVPRDCILRTGVHQGSLE